MSARREDGFSLVELLLAMTLSLLLLGATLAVFATAERGHRDNQRQNEAQDQVRFATDTLARQAAEPREPDGCAAPTPQQPIERANAQDLIFRTVNSAGSANPVTNPQNLQRYRYCLAPDEKRLYVQRQTWSATADPGMPTGTSCPAPAWPRPAVAASSVTNGDARGLQLRAQPDRQLQRADERRRGRLPERRRDRHAAVRRPTAGQRAKGVDADDARLPPQPEPRADGHLHGHADNGHERSS